MNKPITIPEGAPPYICASLLNAAELESESEGRYVEELQRQVEEGQMTQADALRDIDGFPESLRGDVLAYCRDNCTAGHCAMEGFGVELVGMTDPSKLSEANQAKHTFFTDVDTIRACGQMSLGMPIR